MTNFCYLRVSTNAQDVQNQKVGLFDYCTNKGISPLIIIEDTASGKVHWQKRQIGQVLKNASSGDLIIAAEISRLGRSALQVLEILETAAEKRVSVHIAKNNMIMDGSMQSTITATILGLAAQIEREFISSRTKEALAKKKADGIKLGRPKGHASQLKLDSHQEEIIDYLKKGISKRSIAKLVDCAPATLYKWLKRRRILQITNNH